MTEEIQDDKIVSVAQSNSITSGRYDLTACQLDIFFMILANINSQPTGEQGKTIKIYAKDIEAITGRRWDRKQLKDSTTELGNKKIEINTKNNEFLTIWMFQSVQTAFGKGYFEVLLSEPILPYLKELKSNFTVMQLKSALSCSSKYSKRLYALACQWRNARDGKKRYQLGELKEMLGLKDPKGIEKEQYVEIPAFKKYVLDIAVSQINTHTDIKLEYKLIKQGRSFTAVDLFINTKKSTAQIEIDFKEPVDFQKNIQVIKAYGLSEEHAREIAPKHFLQFIAVIEDLNKKIISKKIEIENYNAYLLTVLREKGILKGKKKITGAPKNKREKEVKLVTGN